MKEPTMSFEEKMNRLEQIVGVLESGECSLEDATKLFDEGIKLSAECDKVLQTAMQKINDISSREEK